MDTEAAVLNLKDSFLAAGLNLEIGFPSGRTVRFGGPLPAARLIFRSPGALQSLAGLNANALVESYLRGDLDIEGSFSDVLKLKRVLRETHGWHGLVRFLAPVFMGQSLANRVAIGKHYELDPNFYLSFLDARWPAYSQGIYTAPQEDLAAATERKFQFAAASVGIGPGSRVLEVGPGWGAFLRYILPSGAKLTALTNSQKMKRYLDKIFTGSALSIVCDDFLKYVPEQRFSALTMMGVLEHLPQYGKVCEQFRTLLQPGGRVYLDASAAKVKYSMSSFIYKHVFPYNHSFMHLESFLKAADRARLKVLELHDDSENYRRTIAAWAANLETRREDLERSYGRYDLRRFQLYLWGSLQAFEGGDLQCHRLVLQTPG